MSGARTSDPGAIRAPADDAALPPITFRPIPDTEPPILASWRDAMPPTPGSPASRFVQGELAVDFGNGVDAHDEREFGPQPSPSSDLPEPVAWAGHIAQAVIEVLGGIRPAPQLIRWTAAEVYATVAKRHANALRRGPARGRRPVVRRVQVCLPADGVIEAAAVFISGGRARAMAMRFEGLDQRWVMTALQVG